MRCVSTLLLLLTAAHSAASPLLWSKPIAHADGTLLGTVNIHAGEEPADVAHAFCLSHGLSPESSRAITTRACDSGLVNCTRRRALIYSQVIGANVGSALGALGTVEIFADEEPSDAILAFCIAHNLGPYTRRRIINEACEKIACGRREPIMFRTDVADVDGNVMGALQIADEAEPADVVYAFCRDHAAQMTGEYCRNLIAVVLEKACNVTECTRHRAVAFEGPIRLDERDLGVLKVWHDEEPPDPVRDFCVANNVSDADCGPIIAHVCASAFCARLRPLLARQAVAGPSGDVLGVVDVLLGDEAADKVLRFFVDNALPKAWAQAQITNALCTILNGGNNATNATALGCTRRRGIAASITVRDGANEKIPEPLIVWSEVEGADAAWSFCKANAARLIRGSSALESALARRALLPGSSDSENASLQSSTKAVLQGPMPLRHEQLLLQSRALRNSFYSILVVVCQQALVPCTRAKPRIIEHYPVNGITKPLEVFAWEEVVDALVRWLAHKDVAQKHQLMMAYDGHRDRAGAADGVAERYAAREARRARRKAKRARLVKRRKDRAKVAAAEAAAVAASLSKGEVVNATKLAEAHAAVAAAEALEDEREANATIKAKADHREQLNLSAWGSLERSDAYISLLDDLCSNKSLAEHADLICTRRTPSQLIDTVTVTQYGLAHDAELRRPPLYNGSSAAKDDEDAIPLRVDPTPRCVDPNPHYHSHHHHDEIWRGGAGEVPVIAPREDMMHLCAARAAVDLCDRMRPPPAGCHQSLFDAVRSSYATAETRRWSGKKPDVYVTLGLPKDARYADVDGAYRFERWSVGGDLPPYAPRGNGSFESAPLPLWHPWDERASRLRRIDAARDALINPTGRKFEDQPCEPVFGGAMCAKRTADGGMSIIMG